MDIAEKLAQALRLARDYMSDAVDYGTPCAKRDAGLVDDALAEYKAVRAQPASVAVYSNEVREELREGLIKLFYRERMNEDDAILADKTIELFDEAVRPTAPQPAKDC